MKLGTAVKQVGIVAVGVAVAGLIMYYGRDFAVIGDARRGFDA